MLIDEEQDVLIDEEQDVLIDEEQLRIDDGGFVLRD